MRIRDLVVVNIMGEKYYIDKEVSQENIDVISQYQRDLQCTSKRGRIHFYYTL